MNKRACDEEEFTDGAGALSIFRYSESSFEVMAFLVARVIRPWKDGGDE